MTTRVKLCSLVGLIAVLSTAPDASAVVLVHDQFLETGVLSGKVPQPGPGAAWNPGAQTGINAVTVVNTSSSPVNNEVALIQTEATNGEDIANVFGDQSASGTTFARFDFRLPSADNTTLSSDADIALEGLFFVTLRGTSASTSQRGRVGFVPPLVSGYRMAINADNGNLLSGAIFSQDLAFDTTHRAVFSFDASTAKSKLWIDPVDESSTSVEHAGVSTSIGTIINRIILRQHNSYNGKAFVDNVVVATSFADALNPPGSADYNGDGKIDAADYVTWRGSPGSFGGGDPNGYVLWRENFENPAAAAGNLGTAALVPEPTSIALLFCLCVFGTFQRRRRIHQSC